MHKQDFLENNTMFISITYQVWTEEDVEAGESSEGGFKVEDEEWTLGQVVRELENGYMHLSSGGVPNKNTWISKDEEDIRTGNTKIYSMHLSKHKRNTNYMIKEYWKEMLLAASKGQIKQWTFCVEP